MARCDRKHAKGTRFPTFETREIAEHYQNLRSVITYDLIHGSDFFFRFADIRSGKQSIDQARSLSHKSEGRERDRCEAGQSILQMGGAQS